MTFLLLIVACFTVASVYFVGISDGASFAKRFNSSEIESIGTICAVVSIIISITVFLLIH